MIRRNSMKISTRARYGSRLMLELALYYGQKAVLLKDIAKNEEISEKYLSQIIIPLKAAGLVNSYRGAHGGYVLAKAPDQISLKDIVEILEGGLDLLSCVGNGAVCNRTSICATRDIWSLLGEKISQTLNSITLKDLVNIHKEKEEKVLMYNI